MHPLVGWWFFFKRCTPRLVSVFLCEILPLVGGWFVVLFLGFPRWLAAGWRGKVNRQAWLAASNSCTQLRSLRTAWQCLARIPAGWPPPLQLGAGGSPLGIYTPENHTCANSGPPQSCHKARAACRLCFERAVQHQPVQSPGCLVLTNTGQPPVTGQGHLHHRC